MTDTPDTPFGKHLDCIQDPRHHNTRHHLYDILLISLCAIVSGADSWTQVAEFGRSKFDWFKEFLELPNGIPSHDTFGRLFARIDPKGFQTFAGYKTSPNPSTARRSPSTVKPFADPTTESTENPQHT